MSVDEQSHPISTTGATTRAPRQPTEPSARRGRLRRGRTRKPVRRSLVIVHRWTSLVLGLLLLVVTTSGAFVLYAPEYFRATHSGVYDTTTSNVVITPERAIQIVDAAHPTFKPGAFNFEHGLYEISSSDRSIHYFYGVDPGSGRITGTANPSNGPMAFLENLHECFLTCDDYPGYVAALNDPVPSLGMKWLVDMTWGSLILAMMGLLLLLLVISGIVVWWPGIRRMAHGFRVRWRKGRYARDFDLHKAVGIVALPFLLMWALTGSSFELNFVNTVWYAATDGQTPAEDQYDFASNEIKGVAPADIGVNAAAAAAISAVGGGTLVYASLPEADDATGYYNLYLAMGHDPWRHSLYPGSVGVGVDRHDASHLKIFSAGAGPTLSNTIWDEWKAPVFHYGYAVNGWWRMIWFAFGMTPMLLAVTGVSTWLFKRGVRKRRRQSVRAATGGAK